MHHLVITDKAVLKKASVVKGIALHKKSARVARIAQGHQYLEKITRCKYGEYTVQIW